MRNYILRRILWMVPTLLGMVTFVFILFQIVPGDVVSAMLAQPGVHFTPEWAAQARRDLGLDRPRHVQYLDWLSGFLRLDLGRSLWTGESVNKAIALRLPITLQLVFMSVCISVILGIPLGLIAALKQDRSADYAARGFLIAGLCIPDFVCAILLVVFLIVTFRWFPPLDYANIFSKPLVATQQVIFPAIILGFRQTAVAARMMRSSMLEVVGEDYIRTARAKGVSNMGVILGHALKNALLPVVTVFGVEMVLLFSGAVLVERIFVVPGMGSLLVEAIGSRDYPVIQGCVAVIGLFVLAVNLLVDLVYAALDPRIQYT